MSYQVIIIYNYDTREKRNGGGTSMYVNVHIAYKKRTDLKLNKKYFESCFIEVDKTIFKLNTMLLLEVYINPLI